LIFIKTKRFENIYLASIDSYFCQLIVSNNIKSLVYTFDDGTANIIKNSTYYITEKFSTKQFFYFIAGNRFSKLSIREKSLKHFTIYKNIENISKNKENLSLFNDFDLHSDSILKNNCIVILGTAYHEIAIDIKDCKKIKGRLTKYVKNNNINAEPVFYVPHPRELIENNDILWTVNINVLVEEYIIYLLTRFCNIKLIGFGSTAQINLCEIDRIQNIYLQSCLCKQINNSIHEIEFEIKKLKPNIVNID
jgi:beta-galactosamide-alpha-2,3-sialyltransferase